MYEEAVPVLAAWEGYPSLDVMRRLPDLEVYLTGGVLRDLVLSQRADPRDFDFLIGGPSVDRAIASLERISTMVVGPFGSPRWFPTGSGHTYCDLIPIERFDNGLWPCEDVVDALLQFDFTGNALAHLRTGRLYDPVHGRVTLPVGSCGRFASTIPMSRSRPGMASHGSACVISPSC